MNDTNAGGAERLPLSEAQKLPLNLVPARLDLAHALAQDTASIPPVNNENSRFKEDPRENIRMLEVRKSLVPQRFFKALFNDDIPKELDDNKDKVLAENSQNLLVFTDPDLKVSQKKKLDALAVVNGNLKRYGVSIDPSAFLRARSKILRERMQDGAAIHILKKVDDANPLVALKASEWNKKRVLLDRELDARKKTPEEYEAMLAVHYQEGVEEFGDEEMKKLWKEYEDGKLDISEKDVEDYFVTMVCPDQSMEMSEIEVAYDEVSTAVVGTGVEIGRGFDGIYVKTTDGFSLPLNIKKSGVDGKYDFYFQDATANKGLAGPFQAADVAAGTDDRHIDSFLTQKVQDFLNDNSVIAEIPDEDLIHLVKHLIGQGRDRNFSFDDRNLSWLKNLATILVQPDKNENYKSFYKKVEVLNLFVSNESQAAFLRRKLDGSDAKISVSDLIEEYRSKNQ